MELQTKSWLNPVWTSRSNERTGTVDAYGAISEPTYAELLATYEDTVYACVNRISESTSTTTLRLLVSTMRGQRRPKSLVRPLVWKTLTPAWRQKSASDNLQEVMEHPLLEIIDKPNPDMSRKDFIKAIDSSLSLTGNGYVRIQREFEKEEDGPNYPVYLWPLNTQYVREAVENNEVVGYFYDITTPPKFYPKKDVIHFKLLDPANLYGQGYGPARAAYERINLAKNEMAYLASLYRNQARFDSIIRVKNVNQNEAERMQKQLSQRFRQGGEGGPWVIPGDGVDNDISVEALSWKPKDILGTDLYKWAKLQICNCFNIHPALLDSESSNRSVSYEARHDFELNAVLPRCRTIEEKLNQRLAPEFNSRLMFAFDNPVEEDEELVNKTRLDYLDRDVITINEARQQIGLGPVSWGDAPQSAKPTKETSEKDS